MLLTEYPLSILYFNKSYILNFSYDFSLNQIHTGCKQISLAFDRLIQVVQLTTQILQGSLPQHQCHPGKTILYKWLIFFTRMKSFNVFFCRIE